MTDAALGQVRDSMLAGSGKLLRADGSVLDVTAALESLVAVLGGDTGAGGDLDAIRLIAIAQLNQLQLIEGNTDALETINAFIRTAVEAIQVSNATLVTSNAAILTSAELIDNMIGAIGVAHGTGVSVIGGKAESTVPAEVADGESVALYVDTFGRLIQLFTDLAQNAASVSDIAPAQMAVARWSDWVALTAPAQVTPVATVLDYNKITAEYIIANIDTSVDLILWGSIDRGISFFPIWEDTIDNTELQTDAVIIEGKFDQIYGEFEGEAGGVAATVTFKIEAGN